MKKEGERTDLTSGQNDHKLTTAEQLAAGQLHDFWGAQIDHPKPVRAPHQRCTEFFSGAFNP